jgi:hypothetical protein
MIPAVITPERADAAVMRHWLRQDTRYAAAVVWHGRSSERNALHFLITAALAIAERAGIAGHLARTVAVSEFKYAMAESERRYARMLGKMVDAASGELLLDKSHLIQAANAAADIARVELGPSYLIESAMRIACWRLRRQQAVALYHG